MGKYLNRAKQYFGTDARGLLEGAVLRLFLNAFRPSVCSCCASWLRSSRMWARLFSRSARSSTLVITSASMSLPEARAMVR